MVNKGSGIDSTQPENNRLYLIAIFQKNKGQSH